MNSATSVPPAEASKTSTPPGQADAVEGSGVPSEATVPPPAEPQTVTLQELVVAANRGDAGSLGILRQVLDQRPEIWRKAGNLAGHAEATWARLAAEGNALTLESIRREADRMRADLLGASPTPVERLLVDQIVACFLQVKHAEICAGSGKAVSLMQERFHDQRLEKAQRRYFSALKMHSQMQGLPHTAVMPATSEPEAPPTQHSEPAAVENPFRIFPEAEAREAV